MRPIVIPLPLLFLMVGGCQNEEFVRSVAADEAVRIYSEMMIVETINVSKSLGPYSVAKRVGEFLFISGQVGIDPATGKLNSRGFEAETEQAMENIRNVLTAAGYSFSDVIKSTVYLKEMDGYGAMNAVYGRCVSEPRDSGDLKSPSQGARGDFCRCVQTSAVFWMMRSCVSEFAWTLRTSVTPRIKGYKACVSDAT